MTVRVPLPLLRIGLVVATSTLIAVLWPPGAARPAAPAHASSGADLVASLANQVDAKAGRRVAYTITVKNNGPAAAKHVKIKFTTSTALSKIKYKIASGGCHRHSKEVVCEVRRIKPGATLVATVSGVMPKKIKTGAAVSNKVTLASTTKLVNRGDDVATDDYRLGVPRTPVAASSPAAPDKISRAAGMVATAFSISRSAVVVTIIALIGSALWFVIGLTARAAANRSRRDK